MTAEIEKQNVLEKALMHGDLSVLKPEERLIYYRQVCESLGLNPLTKPFAFIKQRDGKLVLYPLRECTEQLRKRDKVSIQIVAREMVDDCYVVTARASTPDGRHDEKIGAVSLQGLRGNDKAHALMVAETKSCRRVTLSICGLGMVDESEWESVPGVQKVDIDLGTEEKSPSVAKMKTTSLAPVAAKLFQVPEKQPETPQISALEPEQAPNNVPVTQALETVISPLQEGCLPQYVTYTVDHLINTINVLLDNRIVQEAVLAEWQEKGNMRNIPRKFLEQRLEWLKKQPKKEIVHGKV